MAETHVHRCRECGRSRGCQGVFCADPRFGPDLCKECGGQQLIRHNAPAFAALERLARAEVTR